MLLAIIFVVTYGAVVFEVVNRTAAVFFGATLMLALGLAPFHEVLEKVDFGVVMLLVGMMMYVNVLADTGAFEWVAIRVAQWGRGQALPILCGLLVVTAVLSAFLDNVTTVVLVAPITILITQILEVKTAPFLILEAIFATVGGTATLVGDPPNILIASAAGLRFNQFLLHLAPLVLLLTLVLLALVCLGFRGALTVSPEAREIIARADPRRAITQPKMLRRALAVFLLIVLGFVLSHQLGIEPSIVALTGGFLAVLVCRHDTGEALAAVEWEAVFFVVGLFLLVGALDTSDMFATIGARLVTVAGGDVVLIVLGVLWISGFLAAVLGSLPAVIVLIPIVESIALDTNAAATGPAGTQPLLWALALGTCLGGAGTLFAAPANVLVAQIARQNGNEIAWADFARLGVPITVLCLLISSVYLYLRYLGG